MSTRAVPNPVTSQSSELMRSVGTLGARALPRPRASGEIFVITTEGPASGRADRMEHVEDEPRAELAAIQAELNSQGESF